MTPPPAAATAVSAFPKSVERTVFVRFRPSCTAIRRHHLEDLFSTVGPLKKTSVVVKKNNKGEEEQEQQDNNDISNNNSSSSSSFGFVKYTTEQDAQAAVKALNHKTIRVEGQSIQVIVEAASNSVDPKQHHHHHHHHNNNNNNNRNHSYHNQQQHRKQQQPQQQPQQQRQESTTTSTTTKPDEKEDESLSKSLEESSSSSSKNLTRLILRNLAFRTKESHLRQILEQQFGPLIEVHLPTVPNTTNTTTSNNDKSNNHKKKQQQQQQQPPLQLQHRGFGFVRFAQASHAAECVARSPLEIQKRQVQVAYTRNKDTYEQSKKEKEQEEKDKKKKLAKKKHQDESTEVMEIEESEEQQAEEVVDDIEGDEESEEEEEEERSEDSKDDDEEKDSEQDEDEEEDGDEEEKMNDGNDGDHVKGPSSPTNQPDTSIQERRVVFLRNLPFDTTRHDVFELIRKFGHIEAIYLVKNHNKVGGGGEGGGSGAGLFQGSCFVRFAKRQSAETLVQTYNRDSSKFTTQRQAMLSVNDSSTSNSNSNTAAGGAYSSSSGLQFKGREILVDWAVDKETAEAVANDKKSDLGNSAKDRRHLYLKGEGRVDDPTEWQSLPPKDQLKRQRAWSDKLAKLKSPLFFINPTRLSIRNLSKSVDEKALKQLCVLATKRGMMPKDHSKRGGGGGGGGAAADHRRRHVSVHDVILHYKAKGELSHRDILAKLQEQSSSSSTSDNDVLFPSFDENNVKRFIPSVFIDRDFNNNKDKKKVGGEVVAPSRGFGFVEFTHHVHALACLRELNNNPAYREYVAGGGGGAATAMAKKEKRDNIAMTPPSSSRLIVEFTVENVAKAKQQALHRAQQEINQKKQKESHQNTSCMSEKTKKKERKSRGALQRERKRKQSEEAGHGTTPGDNNGGGENDMSARKEKIEAADMPPGQPTSDTTTGRPVKPTAKRRKVDPAETKLNELVESYKRSFDVEERDDRHAGTTTPSPALKVIKKLDKRWFEE